MTTLTYENKVIATISTDWQTQSRGTNSNEYDIYAHCAGDGKGLDSTTGKPLKTYDEWLNS